MISAMAEIPEDVDAVLEFLRKNGFTVAESALREDLDERNQMGTFDFERFLFSSPLPTPPPPVKIPASYPPPTDSTGSSSDDEFVSLGSSEFVNPYGQVSSPRVDSSDGLSQFDSARTFTEWNDFYWHNNHKEVEEEEDNVFMSPAYRESDFFNFPAQDKFIMSSSDTDTQFENTRGGVYDKSEEESQAEAGVDCLDKPCLLNMLCRSVNGEKEDFDVLDKGYSECFDEDRSGYCFEGKDGIDDGGYRENGILACEFGDGEEDVVVSDVKAGTQDEAEVADELGTPRSHDDEYEVFDLRIIHRKNRTGFEESKDLPIVLNTVVGGRYYMTEYLGSAAFCKVVQGRDLRTGVDVCLKIIKNDKDFFDQSLDEIKLLKHVNKHDPYDEHHILRLYDYFYNQEHLFIVCELLRANLYEIQKFDQESGGEPFFNMRRLQVIARQCLDALVYLHGLGIIHCDLKPENILMKSYRRCEIKIIDLGSSCFLTDNLSLYVQSRSYRAPEVILGVSYDEKIDIWSLGCILAELCSGEVLFPNEAVAKILARMVGILGPIDLEMLEKGQETYKYFTKEYDLYRVNEESNEVEYIVTKESSLEEHLQVTDTLFIDFVRTLLDINPLSRPSASHALHHPWLSSSY